MQQVCLKLLQRKSQDDGHIHAEATVDCADFAATGGAEFWNVELSGHQARLQQRADAHREKAGDCEVDR